MVFILVELEKIRRRYTSLTEDVLNDETLAWLYVLARGFEDKGETMKIAEKFPTIEEFAEQYGIAIDDPELKAKYRAYDIAVKEYKSQQKYLARVRREAAEKAAKEAEEEGRAIGRALGREEGLARGREEGLEEGRAQGREEGRAQGREEGRIEGEDAERSRVVAAMRAEGIDEETIARVTQN